MMMAAEGDLPQGGLTDVQMSLGDQGETPCHELNSAKEG
jgi:hypothetical protein